MSTVCLQTTANDFNELKLVAISTLSTYAGDATALFCVHIECVWWITRNIIFIVVKLPSPTTLSRRIKLLEMINFGMSVHRSLIT